MVHGTEQVESKEIAGHARNRCLGTDIDELAAWGLDTGANLDVAVRESGLDEAQVAQLVPDRRVVLNARGAGVPRRAKQRGRGQEPRAQRQQAPPARRRRRGGVARRSRGSGRRGRGGRGAAGRDGERPAAGLREKRRRDLAGRHERRQGGDGWCHGCWWLGFGLSPNCGCKARAGSGSYSDAPKFVARRQHGGLWMFGPATAHCRPGILPGQAASFGAERPGPGADLGPSEQDGACDTCSPEPQRLPPPDGDVWMHSRTDVAARQVGRHMPMPMPPGAASPTWCAVRRRAARLGTRPGVLISVPFGFKVRAPNKLESVYGLR